MNLMGKNCSTPMSHIDANVNANTESTEAKQRQKKSEKPKTTKKNANYYEFLYCSSQ